MLIRVSAITQALVLIFISLVGVLFLGYSALARFADSPAETAARTVPFTIPVGATTSNVAQSLHEAGLIRSEVLFEVLVARRGMDGQLRQGTFLLRSDMTLDEIIRVFSSTQAVQQTVTFPEGWRIEEMADRLSVQSDIDESEFLRIARDRAAMFAGEFTFLADLPEDQTLEGYLFPDTYRIDAATTAEDLIRRMLQRFGQVFDVSLLAAADGMGMSVHEVVTLASIVEREAVLDEERSLIAGVFHNRLASDIPLQADPTVQYVIGRTESGGRWWKPDITRDDFRTQSPYNTYVVDGLPPGPIAAPGLKSIQAVVKPDETPYLFFVARGDGSHAFAETNKEHELNMDKYLR